MVSRMVSRMFLRRVWGRVSRTASQALTSRSAAASAFAAALALALALPSDRAAGQDECPPTESFGQHEYVTTDAYWLEAESASGAVGDVVGVSFFLHSRFENLGNIHLEMAACHDASVAEIVGTPSFSDEAVSMCDRIECYAVSDGTPGPGAY